LVLEDEGERVREKMEVLGGVAGKGGKYGLGKGSRGSPGGMEVEEEL
jgi:hypothetical protein